MKHPSHTTLVFGFISLTPPSIQSLTLERLSLFKTWPTNFVTSKHSFPQLHLRHHGVLTTMNDRLGSLTRQSTNLYTTSPAYTPPEFSAGLRWPETSPKTPSIDPAPSPLRYTPLQPLTRSRHRVAAANLPERTVTHRNRSH